MLSFPSKNDKKIYERLNVLEKTDPGHGKPTFKFGPIC